MRLSVEITTCNSSRTGVGYYAEHLVDALLQTRRAGDEVVLLSNRWPARELATRWAPFLHVGGRGVRAVWMQSDVPRLLAEAGVDVGVFPNYAVPLASPCPSIVVVHDLAILRMPEHFTVRKRLFMAAILKQSVAASSVIGTVSEASESDIVELLGVARERIALLPGAAHPSCRPASPDLVAAVRARYGLARPYVLTVGTLEPRKDLLTILRAFDRLGPEAAGHDLVVVGGRGWKDRKLLRALEARVASRRVRWLGYVAEPDLVALYGGADLFVFAARLEGFGLPVLEAMACGTPVIASDVPALREVGGDVARFVPPGDDVAFARTIAESLRDADGMAALRAAGPGRARHFSWTRTAEALWARARRIAPERVRPYANGLPYGGAYGRADSGIGIGSARSAPEALARLPPPLHPPPPGLTVPEWSLLATVVYADLFDSALPLRQALRATLGVAMDEDDLRRTARSPALSGLLTLHPSGYFVLRGRDHLVEAMPEREARTHELLERNRATLKSLSALPYIRALVISGGVAHKNPGVRPDVDFFVVAARGRAYIAYTRLFLATKLTGTRQLICPNYLVDESELPIAYHRDLFTAHQVVCALPFTGHATYEALCRSNTAWVQEFFPAFAPHPAQVDGLGQFGASAEGASGAQWLREMALWPVAPVLEKLLRWGWRFHLRRRVAAAAGGDVVLGDGILKLHLSDHRRRVMDRFAARLQALRAQLGSDAWPQHPVLDPVGA
ncbi:MAG: glycosyltransferase family 1 protein [Polyangiaceae bacterium]